MSTHDYLAKNKKTSGNPCFKKWLGMAILFNQNSAKQVSVLAIHPSVSSHITGQGWG